MILPIVYFLINFLHAFWHSVRIRKGELILSRRKTAEVIVINLIAGTGLIFFFPFWPIVLFAVLTRAAFYDPLLNILRGKPITYEGTINKEKSKIDDWENKTGLSAMAFRVIYLAAYIIYLIIYLT